MVMKMFSPVNLRFLVIVGVVVVVVVTAIACYRCSGCCHSCRCRLGRLCRVLVEQRVKTVVKMDVQLVEGTSVAA